MVVLLTQSCVQRLSLFLMSPSIADFVKYLDDFVLYLVMQEKLKRTNFIKFSTLRFIYTINFNGAFVLYNLLDIQ